MKTGGKKTAASPGFTLVEMVVILTTIGILAAFAAPRFFSRLSYDTRTFSDKAQSMLRYAQKSAIAKRRKVCVGLSPSNLSLSFAAAAGAGAACDRPLPSPSGDASFSMDSPSGVSLLTSPPTASFSFDAGGKPSLSSRLEVDITGDAGHFFYVEPETGYVHP